MASDGVERARRAGMEVSEATMKLADGQERLVKARVAVHNFRVDAVALPVKEGLTIAAEAHRAGQEALAERLRAIETILDHDIKTLQRHVNSRLGDNCFTIEVLPEARNFLLARGVSEKYGARELKRVIHRQLTQPLATMVTRREINSNAVVQVSVGDNDDKLTIREVGTAPPALPRVVPPSASPAAPGR
jgi:hypothetical protein